MVGMTPRHLHVAAGFQIFAEVCFSALVLYKILSVFLVSFVFIIFTTFNVVFFISFSHPPPFHVILFMSYFLVSYECFGGNLLAMGCIATVLRGGGPLVVSECAASM